MSVAVAVLSVKDEHYANITNILYCNVEFIASLSKVKNNQHCGQKEMDITELWVGWGGGEGVQTYHTLEACKLFINTNLHWSNAYVAFTHTHMPQCFAFAFLFAINNLKKECFIWKIL